MKLSDLSPHPGNPRKITDKKLKMLEKSLKEFGDLSGVIFNKQTGRLVGGHQRLKVIPKDVEIISETEDHGYFLLNGDRFQVRFVNWDETKEKAANIAANQHGGDWDFPILTDWVNELDSQNIDLDVLGFDDKELQKMMSPEGEPNHSVDVGDLKEFLIVVECGHETEQQKLFDELEGRGLKCKLIT